MTQDRTKQVIAAMLTERTGTSILDSGGTPMYDEDGNYTGSTGGYGRHYERNQLRNFEEEPHATVEFWVGKELDVYYSRNVYHFLTENLEYADSWDEFFHEWANERDSHWLADMEAFPEYLRELGFVVEGIYGDGKPFVGNTYNHESCLSQVLQFLYMTVNEVPEEYEDKLDRGVVILLQIHNGADVRGGYTAPRAYFGVNEGGMLLDNDAYLGCSNGHRWYSDDGGYHWYPSHYEKRLKEYPVYATDDLDVIEEFERWREKNGYDKIEPTPEEQPPLKGFPDGEGRREEVNEAACMDIKKYIWSKLGGVAVENHRAYCPLCGEELGTW
jgi:hypothetical protein